MEKDETTVMVGSEVQFLFVDHLVFDVDVALKRTTETATLFVVFWDGFIKENQRLSKLVNSPLDGLEVLEVLEVEEELSTASKTN